jgi:hypothetical protein
MRAFLAATIALSPVVATGTGDSKQHVEAAESDLSNIEILTNYLDRINGELTPAQQADLLQTKTALRNLNWDTYATEILKKPSPSTAEINLVKGLMKLITSSTVLDKNGIEDFRASQTGNIKTVLGDNVSVDVVLSFIADVELKFIGDIRSQENITESDFFTVFMNSLLYVKDNPKDEYRTVMSQLFNMLDMLDTLIVFQDISGAIDTKAKTALIQVVKQSTPPGEEGTDTNPPVVTPSPGPGTNPPVTPPPGPGTNPPVTPPPGTGTNPPVTPPPGPGTNPPVTPPPGTGTNPPVGSSNVITLPEGAAEVVKTNNTSGKVEVITKIVPEKVTEIVNGLTSEKHIIPLKLEQTTLGELVKAQLPAALFEEALKKNGNAVIGVQGEGAEYKLPVSQLNVGDLAKKLGVAQGDVQIIVTVQTVNKAEVQGAISKNNLQLVSNIVEFSVEAVAGNKKESVSTFSTYVERSIVGNQAYNAKSMVAVKLNPDGSFSPIPTIFNGNIATVKSLTNSKYTIVANNKTFSDISNSSWAKPFVDTLASKYIVNGRTNDKFDPSALMTRAEFAVLLVRALGLPNTQYDGSFKDVKGNEWFAKKGEITAAVQNGIVKGVNAETFAPNKKITRAEAAVMIQRAMELKFLNYDITQLNKSKSLADFKDSKLVGNWAAQGVEAVYQAGLVDGKGNYFDPSGFTQRQEMAKILAKFLVSAKLMN